WLDINGNPLTSEGKTIERLRRPSFGNLEIDVTIDDPKAYTKPFTVRVNQRIMLDTELIEFICEDRDATHYVDAKELMKFNGWVLLIAAFSLMSFSGILLAHHSFAAQYDRNKPATLTGPVTKIDWINPHARFFMDVKDAAGKTANWEVELAAP